MNNCSITSEQYICAWIGWVTFTQLSVSLLDSMLIPYDIDLFFEFSSDIGIHNHINWTTVVFVLKDIFLSG